MALRIREFVLPAHSVRSLVWQGDVLVDWAAGQKIYRLDGTSEDARVNYAFGFDAAVATADGEYAIIYTKLGTKGLVLKRGDVVREINRSYYWAHMYEYPVAMFRLESGRAVIAHCPEHYCRLEIEDAETGERLTPIAQREPEDVFHSRLTVSADGKHLASAGWLWHPIDNVRVFDITEGLKTPDHLDREGLIDGLFAEQSAAAFRSDGKFLVTLNGDIDDERDLNDIRIVDLTSGGATQISRLSDALGQFMPVGNQHVLGFYEYPKLIDLKSGAVVQSWPDIAAGKQVSSIIGHETKPPAVIATDVIGKRCAIASDDRITVLVFECD